MTKDEMIKKVLSDLNATEEEKVSQKCRKYIEEIFSNEEKINSLHERNVEIRRALKEFQLPTPKHMEL